MDTNAEVLTVRISEAADVTYTDGPDDSLVQHDVTYAYITNDQGEEIETFTGPVSEDWLPGEWDAALAQAGFRRTSEWDTAGYTATVEPVVRIEIGGRVRYSDDYLAGDPDEPMTGTVVEPTQDEINEAEDLVVGPKRGDVMVQWPDGRRYWESPEDLAVLESGQTGG